MRLRLASVPPVAVAVLAAGQSRRFGDSDKLAATFRGAMLGEHACRTLAPLPFAFRWVIAPDQHHPCNRSWHDSGFAVVANPDAAIGMGSSVALAARLANEAGASALVIALADMPLVPASHFADLLEHVAADVLIASHNGAAPTPPAIFGSVHFGVLSCSRGDEGARHLLRQAATLDCDAGLLVDIDDPATLARYA